MRITNSTAYNTPVVVTLAPAVAAPPRVASKVSPKELKIDHDSAEILNVPAVAALMGVAPATVREMCRRGAIPARKVLQRYYITKRALLRFLENGDDRENET